LASKIDQYGLKVFEHDYNIFNSDIKIKEAWYTFRQADRKFGTLTDSVFASETTGLETANLSHHPPLLPFLLAISHRIFSSQKAFLVNWQDTGIEKIWPQFYAAVIPFLASLLLVIMTYLLGRIFFSQGIASFAALLLVFTPIDMLTAQKIWADDLVSLISLLSIILYLKSLQKDNTFLAGVSGLLVGIAALAKQSGMFLVAFIPIIHFVFLRSKQISMMKLIFEKRLIIFLAFAFLSLLPWISLFMKTNGIFNFFIQYEPMGLKSAVYPTDFIRFVNTRPWYTYFLTVFFQQPLFIFVYLSPLLLLNEFKKRKELLVLLVWVALFFVLVTVRRDKELRYMLPAYPAVTLLTSFVFFALRERFNQYGAFFSRLANAGLILFSFFSIALAAKIGLTFVFLRASLIPIPV
jgi:4-amino-4-deoxy-L-arabinose transferase-like glycosyltransferase